MTEGSRGSRGSEKGSGGGRKGKGVRKDNAGGDMEVTAREREEEEKGSKVRDREGGRSIGVWWEVREQTKSRKALYCE